MENRPYSVSRNVSNGISIMEKNPYNDVLSGQPKFGVPSLSPRLDDYSEMFGGFLVPRGSSIPVLDLPVIDEADACFDVRRLDYSDVFGGFNDLDFAVEFDELLSQAKNREVSSEESWTPIESDCLSEESYPSACSRKSESLSNGDPHPASNGAKQFSVAYQANKSEEMLNEAHVTELHALPGFTCVIDETHSLHKTKCQNPTLQVNGGEKLSVDLAAQEVEKKKLRRSMSHPSNNITGRHAFDGEFDLQNRYNQNGLDTSRTFLTISEISLKTVPSHLPPPSRPPPTLDVRKGTCSNHASEGIAGDSSAPFFDVELDASSSAEISAAAMKAAMEKAQARLKSAKESIEKKKGGLQCGMKNGSKNDIKDKGRKASNVFDVSSNSVDDDKTFCGREDDDICSFIKEEGEIVKRTTRVASEPVKEKDPGLKKGSAEDKGSKQSLLSHKCCNGKGPGVWEEEKYFFEVINTDRPKYDVDHATSNNILMLNTEPHEHGHKKRIADVEVFDQQVGVGKKINPVTPVFEKFEVEKKEKPVKERPKLEVHEKKPCTAQEDFKQEWCEQNETITREQVITKKQQREADNWEKQEILMEGHLYANEVEVEILRHNKKEQKAPCVNGRVEARKHQEKEQIYKDANKRIINDRKLNGAFEREGEKSVHGFFDQEEHERRLKQAFHHAQLGQRHKQPEEERLKKSGGCKKNERKQKEACKKEKNEARVKDGNEGACGIEQRDKRLKDEKEKDIHGKEEMEERLEGKQQQSHEDKEHEKLAKDSKQEKACEKKEYEKRLRNAELKGKQPAALENGIHKKNEGDACGRDACEMRLREASAGEEMKQRVEFFEQEESVQELSERKEKGCEESEEELKASLVGESLRGLQNSCEKSVRNANEQNAELVEGTYERVEGEIVKPADPLSNAEQKPLFQATEGACRCEENSISMEVKPKILADADIGENLKAGLEDDEGEVRKDEKPTFPIDDKLKSSTVQSFFMDETPKQYGRPVDGIGETLGSIDPVNKKSEVSGEKGSNSDQKENQDRFDLSAQAEKEETENRNKIGPAHEEKNPRGREKLEDKEKERRLRRERELELECLSKLEDEREREREREKDRMDIERATREACGRAYAVERATVEARQRALSETRDRLGRAAAERAASEARERLERSLSMRNSEMRQRSSSPGHGSDNAKSEGVEGESAQRCKAKLERYRRTTERAEKALAEKNMRDLLAQREQAERNRLAESLDAEVKRWSSGKEGNLRALLSTLQYILGLDSGWQPVPLTEVITSAAVKKAYRKATLCVHPDKLQQRGASIQHKYICEKVFDLLKESWNKFNSEER